MNKYYFFCVHLDKFLHIGQTIYNPYGRKCTVENIKNVERLGNGQIQVEGIAIME